MAFSALRIISRLTISTQMETLPFEIGETAHALRKAFDRLAVGLGVTRAQWKVLFKLTRTPGLRQVELADMLDLEPITLCRIVDRLEEAGLVERVRDPEDRRAWRLHVTAKAQPLIEKLQAVGVKLVDHAFGGIDPADVEIARRVLAQARENAARSANLNKASNA
jgi:MarR family transcriptional regulator, transcriptional regulator for hemolysin